MDFSWHRVVSRCGVAFEPVATNFRRLHLSLRYVVFVLASRNAYLLAVASDLDPKGSLPVIAAVISQVGLASGPLMASGLIASDGFSLMLTTCASLFVLSLLCAARPAFSNQHSNQQTASNP